MKTLSMTDPRPLIDVYVVGGHTTGDLVSNPWDDTGESEVEYCRRIARENEPQTYRLHITEELTGRILSNGLWRWRMISGVSISVHGERWRVTRITPHPKVPSIDVVWVEREK